MTDQELAQLELERAAEQERAKGAFASIEGVPKTLQQYLTAYAIAFTRETAVFKTIFAQQFAVSAGLGVRRIYPLITDSPEVQFFHVRLQSAPGNPVGNEIRYLVNRAGPTNQTAITADTLANGNILTPGSFDDVPVMRSRNQPVWVDLAGGALDGDVIVTVFDMRKLGAYPT